MDGAGAIVRADWLFAFERCRSMSSTKTHFGRIVRRPVYFVPDAAGPTHQAGAANGTSPLLPLLSFLGVHSSFVIRSLRFTLHVSLFTFHASRFTDRFELISASSLVSCRRDPRRWSFQILAPGRRLDAGDFFGVIG